MPNPFNNRMVVPIEMAYTPQSRAAEAGDYFVGQITRTAVTIANTYYWLVTADTKRDLFVQNILPSFDISAVTTGAFYYKTEMFLRDSNKNDYVYSGGSANASFGTPTNGYMVNKQSTAKLSAGGTAPTLTGTPDFVINDAMYYLATQGNSSSSSGTQASSLFQSDRLLIIPAGSTALVRSVSSGTAGGTYGVDTFISFFERDV